MDRYRCHRGDGDMWPITWADDDHLYGGAGDNSGSPMNVWRISNGPSDVFIGTGWGVTVKVMNNLPVDPAIYCRRPDVHPRTGVKPAGILSVGGRLYLAVELHNYGDNPSFNRQHNVCAWIITSDDHGVTWNLDATPVGFFTGRFSSPHFVQFGRDYDGARDDFVYATFPVADDGCSYWENGDALFIGRVGVDRILDRESWEFLVDGAGLPEKETKWAGNPDQPQEIFRYPLMTGENHVTFNRGLGRYLMGNYGFLDPEGNPRPYHSTGQWPYSALRSQLTLFEAPEPWGPWHCFHIDDDWGTYGDYQPVFPTKWMSADGTQLLLASSGSFDDYNLTLQRVDLVLGDPVG